MQLDAVVEWDTFHETTPPVSAREMDTVLTVYRSSLFSSIFYTKHHPFPQTQTSISVHGVCGRVCVLVCALYYTNKLLPSNSLFVNNMKMLGYHLNTIFACNSLMIILCKTKFFDENLMSYYRSHLKNDASHKHTHVHIQMRLLFCCSSKYL